MGAFASARDLFRANLDTSTVSINGIEKPIQVHGLTVRQAEKFIEITKKNQQKPLRIHSWLIKTCCPAFRWVPISRIENKLSRSVMLKLSEKIMELSGLRKDSLENAEKKSEGTPGNASS